MLFYDRLARCNNYCIPYIINTLTKKEIATMKNLILLFVIAYALINATPAAAQQPEPESDNGPRTPRTQTAYFRAAYVPTQPKHHNKENDSACTAYNVPALIDYLDGDTPTDIAYSDYLEDLNWWYGEQTLNANPCQITPETLP